MYELTETDHLPSGTTESDRPERPDRRRRPKPGDPIRMPARLSLPLAIGAVAAVMLLVRRGDLVTAAAVVTVALSGWAGFKMGLGRIVATILAIIAAIGFAPSLGLRFENRFAAQFGTTGLTNRFLCIAAIGVLISLSVTILFNMLSHRFIAKRRKLRWFNQYTGFAIGIVEGVMIVWLVLGALLSLQKWQRGVKIDNNRVAQAVDYWASETRQSLVGPMVRDYNPFERFETLAQIGNVQQTVRRFTQPKNLGRLMDDPMIHEMRVDPEVASAIDEIREDRAIKALIEQGRPLDGTAVMRMMNSHAVMRLVDRPEFARRARAILSATP
jgi:hypothetical protein